jgi:hypothetical protein
MTKRKTLTTAIVTMTALAVVSVAMSGAATRTATEQFEPSEDAFVDATCPAGRRAILAGLRGQYDTTSNERTFIEGLERPTKDVVRAEGYVATPGPGKLTAIATCRREPRSKQVVETTTVDGGEEASVTAQCPVGRRLVFGGFRGDMTFFDQFVTPIAAYAESSRRWTVVGVSESGPPGELTALAYCGKVAKVKERSATASAKVGDEATATAKCKRKQRFAFGGFDIDQPGVSDAVVPTALEKTGRREWSVSAFVNHGDLAEVTSFAYCRKKK